MAARQQEPNLEEGGEAVGVELVGVELVGVELVGVELVGVELVAVVLAVGLLEADAVVGLWILDGDDEMVVERDFVETCKLE
ncbi:MAG: hypothetical protein ASARMPRED_004583 [Alectoria sarmentosa]|nr:MAG: hypothetical protein ASARMPRED_004583 [Alectoria sarmentosa]